MAAQNNPDPVGSCGLVKPTGENLDMAWQWNSLKDINNKRYVTCDFCGKVTTGGITRAKRHQIGLKGDVGPCKKIPAEIKKTLTDAYMQKLAEKDAYSVDIHEDDDILEEVQEIQHIKSGKRSETASSEASTGNTAAAKRVKGPLDLLFFKKPEASQPSIKVGKGKRQTSINDACNKEARARTIQYIERFLCTNGIPFNVVRSKSFKYMVEAIGNYGPGLKVPSYYECRVPLLKKELDYTKDLLKDHAVQRANYGCSIMSDGWTDRKNRTLINFLVNSPSGSMFVKSIDASSYVKSGAKLFELLDTFVEEIGEKNVVQVVTDNGSNYVLAGKLLQAKREHLFWTPCAAHCLDLMLEDIGKIGRVKKAIQKGIKLVGFIYNHTLALNTMRKYTSKTELVRHGVTRFATTFLTLQRLHKQKHNLRKMFTSDDWLKSNIAKDPKGKRATDTVLMPSFWNDVIYSLKVMGPLVRVLRLVDNEKRPAMGYIYEAMDRAKEAIQKSFNGNEDKYRDVFAIIDRRWDCQLHHPLHAAGHYLNPEYFYANPKIDDDAELMTGLYKCIDKLSANEEEVDKIHGQLEKYRSAEGLFGMNAAIRQRNKIAPAQWWKSYGAHVPNLRNLAIRVLGLTCSSSGCERNWSTFEHIHSKKRSRLEHQRLQDLVFIKYNQALKERFESRDLIDPIVLKDIDESNEWLVGEMGEDAENEFVFDDDNLTWGDVANVTGVNEPITYTRQHTRFRKETTSMPTSSSGIRAEVEQIEGDNEDIEDEDEQIYKLDTSEESEGGQEEDFQEMFDDDLD